jgi:hypothetical protein
MKPPGLRRSGFIFFGCGFFGRGVITDLALDQANFKNRTFLATDSDSDWAKCHYVLRCQGRLEKFKSGTPYYMTDLCISSK